MGKPFESELKLLEETYTWSLDHPIDELISFVKSSNYFPLIAVGSGGSLTAANMAVQLHQKYCTVSKAITPLDLLFNKSTLKNTSILFLTAGGSNVDILNSFKYAAEIEPYQLTALCMKLNSPISEIGKKYRYSKIIEYELPCGKDGFLATNSLLSFISFLTRAYKNYYSMDFVLPNTIPSYDKLKEDVSQYISPLLLKNTWSVLYGGWGQTPAIDLESKMTESALWNIQLADYRNFAHGRHHWFAKNDKETGIIALITPDEKSIADKTLSLIPKNIPIYKVETNIKGPSGSLELLLKVFHIVRLAGIKKGIDPGKPGVPLFGSKLYNLKIPKQVYNDTIKIDEKEKLAIERKIKSNSLKNIVNLPLWKNHYINYKNIITSTKYGAIIFDYDGTLCDPSERLTGICNDIENELERLLSNGLIIGIATGRGKSVRFDLQKCISEKYWNNIIIGYYNGAEIAYLKENNKPDINQPLHNSLIPIKKLLDEYNGFYDIFKYDCRPKQISIEIKHPSFLLNPKQLLLDIIMNANISGVRILESSHSIDIIASCVSKLNLISDCEMIAKKNGNPDSCLCIGDKGEWPGNDYELLSSPYSLSVDTVSSIPYSCWNFCPPGFRGAQATLYYLSNIKARNGVGYFSKV